MGNSTSVIFKTLIAISLHIHIYLLEEKFSLASEDSTEIDSELLAVRETAHLTGCLGGASFEVVLSIRSNALNRPDLKSLLFNLASNLCLSLLRPT